MNDNIAVEETGPEATPDEQEVDGEETETEELKKPGLDVYRNKRTGETRVTLVHAGRAGKVFQIGPTGALTEVIPPEQVVDRMVTLPAVRREGKSYLAGHFEGILTDDEFEMMLEEVKESYKAARNAIASGSYAAALAKASKEGRTPVPRQRWVERSRITLEAL